MPEDNKRSNTFEFGASLENFKSTIARREALPENLDRPLRALVAQLAAMIEQGPVSVYITSEDADRELRNHFAFLLATYLRDREQSTLLIDADYMSVGLSGLVPQKDALGFLDLLLYGSSLGVITQDGPGHLRVIGAGSFPVAKRSPFILEAFNDAHRYLLSHSKCLLYVGPVLDDADEANPLAGQLDLVIAVGQGRRQRIRASKMEDKLYALVGQRMWHVRIVEPAQAAPTPQTPVAKREEPPAPAEAPVAPPVAADESSGFKPLTKDETPVPDRLGSPTPPPLDDKAASGESAANSALPRIVTFVVGFLVVAFIVWWLYQTKVFREGSEPNVASRPPAEQTPPPANAQPGQTDVEPAVVDTQMTPSGQGEGAVSTPAGDGSGVDTADAGGDAGSVEVPADTATTTKQTATGEPAPSQPAVDTPPPAPALEPGVKVAKALSDYAGAYLIHISSFRELDRAQLEAQQLADQGFAVIVALIDTGSKGFYHRVYVGPYKYREAARMEKIKLDEIPFVKFTRITKVGS